MHVRCQISCLRVSPQVLPFASEETLSQLEQNIERCGAMTDMLHEGATPRDITERLLQGLGVSDGGFSLRPRCPCCFDSAVACSGHAHLSADLSSSSRGPPSTVLSHLLLGTSHDLQMLPLPGQTGRWGGRLVAPLRILLTRPPRLRCCRSDSA